MENMNRIQKAQENFLKIISDFYKDNPNQYFTSGNITKEFELESGLNNQGKPDYWFIFCVLKILEKRGQIKKGPHGKGFKYINKG